MAGYCTLVLYFHSPAARENMATHSCNIQPYYLLTHRIVYMYVSILKCTYVITSVTFPTYFVGAVTFLNQMELDSAAKKVMLNYVGNSKCACYYYYM